MAKPKPIGPNITTERIAALMREQAVTQKALAASVGVTPLTIHRWIKGENNICSHNLNQVADALNTTVEYLIGVPGSFKNKLAKDNAEAEFASMFGDELYAEEDEEEIAQRTKEDRQRRTVRNGFFLRELGYSYQEAKGAQADFSGIFCTLKDEQGHEYIFDHDGFQQLMSQIKDIVDFACFKNRNVVHDCGGIRPEPQEQERR